MRIKIHSSGWWSNEYKRQLEQINASNIYFVDNSQDVNYWIICGSFLSKKEVIGIDIVCFNHPKKYWEECIKQAHHCIFQSKRYFDSVDIPNKSLISMGLDLEVFKPKIKIGIVACLQNRKNIEFLKQIIEQVSDKFEFHVCGPRWGEELNHYKNVKYHGEIPYKDMPEFYQNLNYLLITSTMEGGPYPLIEALACEVQVLTTDVGYVGEVYPIVYKDKQDLLIKLMYIECKHSGQIKQYSKENFENKHIQLFRRIADEYNFYANT